MSDSSEQPNQFDLAIAELEMKVQALQNAILEVKKAKALATGMPVDLTPSSQGTGGSFVPTTGGNIPSDAFFNMKVPDAIKKYLAIAKRPKTPNEISDALQKGGIPTTSNNFYSVVNTALQRLKTTGEAVKLKKEWGLAEWYPGRNKVQKPKEESKEVKN